MRQIRRHARINASLPVKYWLLKTLLGHSCHTKNISESGICLPVANRFETGRKLMLNIDLPNSQEALQIVGEIKWLREVGGIQAPFEAGIQFSQINPSAQQQIIQYIKTPH